MTATPAEPIWREWFSDKELTKNWLGEKLIFWFDALAPLRDKPSNLLEVGSYEGRSAIAFLEYLPRCHLTAVDIFVDPNVEARFDRNMRRYGSRVTKIKDRAAPTMDRMLKERVLFDVIYLDTGKSKSVSFVYSALAWPLLRTGGVIIWDDLIWGQDRPEDDQPGAGIRLFADMFSDCLDVLHKGKQLIARKTGVWPIGR